MSDFDAREVWGELAKDYCHWSFPLVYRDFYQAAGSGTDALDVYAEDIGWFPQALFQGNLIGAFKHFNEFVGGIDRDDWMSFDEAFERISDEDLLFLLDDDVQDAFSNGRCVVARVNGVSRFFNDLDALRSMLASDVLDWSAVDLGNRNIGSMFKDGSVGVIAWYACDQSESDALRAGIPIESVISA